MAFKEPHLRCSIMLSSSSWNRSMSPRSFHTYLHTCTVHQGGLVLWCCPGKGREKLRYIMLGTRCLCFRGNNDQLAWCCLLDVWYGWFSTLLPQTAGGLFYILLLLLPLLLLLLLLYMYPSVRVFEAAFVALFLLLRHYMHTVRRNAKNTCQTKSG